MHWRQREMLFEQREALKEQQSGTMRKKKSGKKANQIATKDPRGTDMSGDTPKPRPGKSAKRRFEGKQLKERVPAGAHRAISRTLRGGGAKDPKKKKKTESHCEAYAEAYVRGVERAMNESLLLEYTPIPPFMVEFTMGSLNSLQSAIANGETEFDVGSGYMLPVSLFLGRDGSINTFIVNQLFGANLSEFSDILGVDVPYDIPTGPPFPPPGEPELPLTRDAILDPVATTRKVTGYSRPNPPMPGGGGTPPFYPGGPGNYSRGGGKAGPM